MNGWLKVYRDLGDHEIMKDAVALQVFMWLLTHVKRDGTRTIGRYVLAQELGVNPNTLYSAMKRLEKKYKIINIKSNNRFSEITLLNWAKYQSSDSPSTQGVNNRSTTDQQQINTKQEVENKELRIKEKERDREKETVEIPKTSHTSLSYLDKLPEIELQEFHAQYQASVSQIVDKAEQLANYCRANGKKYKDYRAFLRNALAKDFQKRAMIAPPVITSEISSEEAERNWQKFVEQKTDFLEKVKGLN